MASSVQFTDLQEVDGYVIQQLGTLAVPAPTVLITDDIDKAMTVLRVSSQRRLRVVPLWRAPDGTLLWKNTVKVAG